MEFFGLSLPEASFLYIGLALQAVMRRLLVRPIMPIVTIWLLIMMWRRMYSEGSTSAHLWRMGGYFLASLLTMALFWPESTPFGRLDQRALTAGQVASYAATQDPEATVVTAEDTQMVPEPLRNPLRVPTAFRLLLREIIDANLMAAKFVNQKIHRTFASLMPIQWLLGVELTADATTAIKDWVHSCYLPVNLWLQERGRIRTAEDFLPWSLIMQEELAHRSVVPAANTGITWLRGGSSTSVFCDHYLLAVETVTQGWLGQLKSPRGTPLIQVFEDELQLTPPMQAQFFVYREIVKAAGPAVPPPSLTGQYLGLRGARVVSEGVSIGSFTGAVGLLSGSFSWAMTLFGMGRGTMGGLTQELQRVIDVLSWFVGIAAFLAWWGPYVVGITQMVVIGMFPLVLLWSLIPGRQLMPLVNYFVTLYFITSVPLWWALVDLAANVAKSQAPQATDTLIAFVGNWAPAMLWSTVVTCLGIFLIPVVIGSMVYATFTSIGNVWRTTV